MLRIRNSNRRKSNLGQSTVEYLLMVAFGAIFAIQLTRFFNDVFRDGLRQLEGTISIETETGRGFAGKGGN